MQWEPVYSNCCIIDSSFAIEIVAVSTVVTSVLVSVISVLISSSVVYLVMKRKYTSNGRDYPKNEESNNKATVIYDLPNVAVDGKIIQPNAAYGVIWILNVLL